MLIKTLILHSLLPCVVAIASSIVANESALRGSAADLEQGASKEASIFAGQIVNRAVKSERLPVKPAQPQANDKAPVRIPAHCKPPTDVLGRCFANLKVNPRSAPSFGRSLERRTLLELRMPVLRIGYGAG